MEPWIQTFTGKAFNPLVPDSNLLCIEDIAHSLSMVNRFAGHTCEPRSVATHSIDVCSLLARRGYSTATQLLGLLHDASEAFLNDIATPVKQSDVFKQYRIAEQLLQGVIERKFMGFDPLVHQGEVRCADMDMLIAERFAFMGEGPWRPQPPPRDAVESLSRHGADWKMTKVMFLRRFRELGGID